LQFYPWRAYAVDLLSQGELPLWNPYNGAGAPLFANYQSSLLYPTSWLSFLLPLAPTMSITAVLHLFIAGWGMWRFTGRLGYNTLGRGISALAFALTSYLVARLGTFPMIQAASWLPWLCWAALGIVEQRRRLDAAWLALFSALILLAGHAQLAWYSLLLTGIFAFWRWLKLRPRHLLTLVGLAAAVLLGAGIAALQMAGTGELLANSQRAEGVERDFGLNFSYGTARTLNLLSPNIFGTPADGSYFTQGAFFEDAVYVGLLPLVSAVAALIYWLRKRRAEDRAAFTGDIPFWALITSIAFLFALGQNTPIYPFLYENIPTFDLFQAPVRWHLWTVFGLALLAGAGVAGWGRGRRARAWSGRLTAICAALALVGGLAPLALTGMGNEDTAILLGSVFVSAIIGVAAGILSLLQPDPASNRHPRWALAVLLLVALDLVWAASGLNPIQRTNFNHQSGDTSATRRFWTPDAVEAVQFDTYFRLDDYRVAVERWQDTRASGLPNLNLLDGVPSFNNFDPLLGDSYRAYLTLLEQENPSESLLTAAHIGSIYNESGNLEALPAGSQRAWFVRNACWHSDEASLTAALQNPDWQPQQQVHLLGSGDCSAIRDASEAVGNILAFEDRFQTLTISLETDQAGWLVLADTYYPGWIAEVNGQPSVIERANLAFRAVAVTPDTRTIRLLYQPRWLLPAALISGVSLLLLLALFRVGMNDARAR
jgi:hypothetical protein